MTMTIRRHSVNGTSAGAPDLTGQAGSFIAVMDHCLVAGCGWTKEFSGTNLATYRAPTGNRFRFAVDDTGAQSAVIRGLEVATEAGVLDAAGSQLFPTTGQAAAGLYHYKSSVASATARPWAFFSNGSAFYFLSSATGALGNFTGMFFGDTPSFKAGDTSNTSIAGATLANQSGQGLIAVSIAANASSAGHYLARSHTQVAGAVACGKSYEAQRAYGTTSMGAGGVNYPAPITGGMELSACYANEVSIGIRARFPGLWNPLHPTAQLPSTGDTFSGSGLLAGKTFEVFKMYADAGCLVMETSDTWGTY